MPDSLIKRIRFCLNCLICKVIGLSKVFVFLCVIIVWKLLISVRVCSLFFSLHILKIGIYL